MHICNPCTCTRIPLAAIQQPDLFRTLKLNLSEREIRTASCARCYYFLMEHRSAHKQSMAIFPGVSDFHSFFNSIHFGIVFLPLLPFFSLLYSRLVCFYVFTWDLDRVMGWVGVSLVHESWIIYHMTHRAHPRAEIFKHFCRLHRFDWRAIREMFGEKSIETVSVPPTFKHLHKKQII